MTIKGRTRSILLQVAFKEAAEDRRAQQESLDIKKQTAGYYDMLIELHGELNIDPEDGGFTRGSGGGRAPSTFVKPDAETFIYNGVLVEDFRVAKAAPGSTVNANYPDFKTADGSEIAGITNDKGAAWLRDQDGGVNEALTPLVTMADQRVL
ncbi:hypothetical protein LCGC14_2028290 [marine sediment metagenome]|uniref:Uncharacterized protein n=1 Tax=marine sediment metagenome TaxID=412755 RepID=A0A0F9FHY7_9ZZZZ